MIYFQAKKIGKILEGLAIEDVGIFLWYFGIFYCNVVYFKAIWYTFMPCCTYMYYVIIWYIFPPPFRYVAPTRIWQPCKQAERKESFFAERNVR
jgi:hypothetical protein